MDMHKLNKKLRIFAAFVIGTFIFIIIIFLTQSHQRKSIKEILTLIPDPNLKVCIQENTQKEEYAYAYQVKELVCKLKLTNSNNPLYIKDLTGIENLRYLEKLDLSNSQLKSLTPLKHLTALKTLNLSSANIFVIDDLSKLVNLESLDLSNNSIEDSSALSSLSKLKKLNLAKNNISSMGFLKRLIHLEELDVEANLLSTVPSLHNLSNLKILNLSDNRISNISFLDKLTELKALNLARNRIIRIDALENLDSLERLSLANNRVTDIRPLSKLTINRMNLSSNRISTGINQLYIILENPDENKESMDRLKNATINLENNTNARCKDIQILKAKLYTLENLTLLEPKVCSSQPKPTYTKKRKKRWKFWH